MPLAITIVVILIAGAILGTALNFAGIFLGLPFALVAIGVVVGRENFDRQSRILRMKRFRREARAQKAELTPADRRTLI